MIGIYERQRARSQALILAEMLALKARDEPATTGKIADGVARRGFCLMGRSARRRLLQLEQDAMVVTWGRSGRSIVWQLSAEGEEIAREALATPRRAVRR